MDTVPKMLLTVIPPYYFDGFIIAQKKGKSNKENLRKKVVDKWGRMW